jgi:hypothetical protein
MSNTQAPVSRRPRLPRMRRWRWRYSTDPEGLRACVVECFGPVQLLWANRNGEALADYVSEPMGARLKEEFDELDRNLAAHRIEDLALHDVRVAVPAAADSDSFTAQVSFSAREWTEDLRTGTPIDVGEGRPERMTFEQRWRFVRRDARGWVVDRVTTLEASPARD